MRITRFLAALATLVWLGGCAAARPGSGMAVPAADLPQATDMAERMREMARPGPEHERLASLAGTWQIATEFRSSQPGARATLTEGEARNTAMIGGRFLQSEIRETWAGLTVDAVVRLGFDRRTGRHTLSRCDSWGTYCVDAEGTANAEGLLMLEGRALDPLGRDTETYRFVLDLRSPDRYSMAIDFVLPGGGTLRTAQSTFTRRAND